MFLIVTVPKNYSLLLKCQPHMRTSRMYNMRGCTHTNATQLDGAEVGGHQCCFRFGGRHVPPVPTAYECTMHELRVAF